MTLRRRATSYLSLPSRDRQLVRAGFLLLAGTRAMLLVTGVPRTRATLARLVRRYRFAEVPPDRVPHRAVRTARLVLTAARYLRPHATCLHRSLVIECLLEAQGIQADVRFGVRRGRDGFEAHAWVEHNGHALTEKGEEGREYVPLLARARPGRDLIP